MAHSSGVVVFLGTKSQAVARALHKINGGTKACLAPCTTGKRTFLPDGSRPFDDWRGFQWSSDAKKRVLEAKHKQVYVDLLERLGKTRDDALLIFQQELDSICNQNKNIRSCNDEMLESMHSLEKRCAIITQSATKDSNSDDTCVAACGDHIKELTQDCCVL